MIDFNQLSFKLNIWFTLKDIKFTICTKISCWLRLVATFGKERCQQINDCPQPLLLDEVGPNQEEKLMLVSASSYRLGAFSSLLFFP
jgi:hypothetical protein